MARQGALTPFAALVPTKGPARLAYSLARGFERRGLEGRAGERLAEALRRQGPAFVKAGQALSTRPDLVGAQAAQDLTRLQDKLPAAPCEAIEPILRENFETDLADVFHVFDPEALSAASIAQVHFATLTTGQEVAVKIIRPGVEKAFRRDVAFLTWLARGFEQAAPRFAALKARWNN